MILLEHEAALQRANVMTKMKRTRCAVAGQDYGQGLGGGHGRYPGEGRRQTGRINTQRKVLGPEVRRRRV